MPSLDTLKRYAQAVGCELQGPLVRQKTDISISAITYSHVDVAEVIARSLQSPPHASKVSAGGPDATLMPIEPGLAAVSVAQIYRGLPRVHAAFQTGAAPGFRRAWPVTGIAAPEAKTDASEKPPPATRCVQPGILAHRAPFCASAACSSPSNASTPIRVNGSSAWQRTNASASGPISIIEPAGIEACAVASGVIIRCCVFFATTCVTVWR